MLKLLLFAIVPLCSIKVLAQKREAVNYHNDFRVVVGVPPLKSYFDCLLDSQPEVYYSPVTSLFYGRRIIKGLKVAVNLAYHNNNARWSPEYGIERDSEQHLRITPTIQYEWFHRGIVTMYSDVGYTFEITRKEYQINGNRPDDSNGSFFYARPNFTPFGIIIGKKLYGCAELFSFGPRGFFNLGIGYRF